MTWKDLQKENYIRDCFKKSLVKYKNWEKSGVINAFYVKKVKVIFRLFFKRAVRLYLFKCLFAKSKPRWYVWSGLWVTWLLGNFIKYLKEEHEKKNWTIFNDVSIIVIFMLKKKGGSKETGNLEYNLGKKRNNQMQIYFILGSAHLSEKIFR